MRDYSDWLALKLFGEQRFVTLSLWETSTKDFAAMLMALVGAIVVGGLLTLFFAPTADWPCRRSGIMLA